MVTGSHIPADRNGIKFTKRSGEILKSDEPGILEHVRKEGRNFIPSLPKIRSLIKMELLKHRARLNLRSS